MSYLFSASQKRDHKHSLTHSLTYYIQYGYLFDDSKTSAMIGQIIISGTLFLVLGSMHINALKVMTYLRFSDCNIVRKLSILIACQYN
jgi:hypothetical protein